MDFVALMLVNRTTWSPSTLHKVVRMPTPDYSAPLHYFAKENGMCFTSYGESATCIAESY